MILRVHKCFKRVRFLPTTSNSSAFFHTSFQSCSSALSSPLGSSQRLEDPTRLSDLDIIISTVPVGSTDDQVLLSLSHDQACNSIQLTHVLVHQLFHRFKNDWKSALGVFRWAESRPGYKLPPDAYDVIIDVLGKMRQMDQTMHLLERMHQDRLVTLNTVGKVMRRFAGAGKWEDAVRIFDGLGRFGLDKNTESMNLLLDTLCKENKVEVTRDIFLELKSHISPNAHTFNIFIHGWCKVNRVDEAHWTIQEMKGHGCRPCAISYSTIILFYCHKYNFGKVYELFDEMEAQGCPPNVVTFTTVMCYLAKSEEFEEAMQLYERMKSAGCKPDTLFYNSLIHTLGRAGRVREAIHVFEVEMPENEVPHNTSTYNTMIAMFCNNAQEEEALKILRKMESSGLCKPDVQTYYPLLKMCFKTGKTDNCLNELVNDMVNGHHLSLDLSTYTLLIHGLCRAGKCEWAYSLFKEMIAQEMKPRYKTCRLLWDEVKLKNMSAAADSIADFMKKL
ncbi:putative tetratricopeptide-like helical domain, pentacotripeptide-repeat region of PROPR [Rosa chinensis]|uniref:Putative tetratricopeptide-like helical domain, pentacotripeptide-repeat region of PROPR n=1 Tax=Rosa chinensis TaxID=74649 RepID=A0A2P6PDL1_ROSCH|nr:pentatricopeptide repeat-containing protein At3g04130, mitochondrial [Rosa chinensis]XP_040368010.1 pentatricopeptide repeat-containing protein At3g04130, mitochondrial [Rosa chinensis]XP_040368011.1 pentatricopeptide repeat-containing protein At3g04130, mitochondrial [Rosa chinensis]XP_040368012.1 pentatricopeptide repeat-containing protein At3g04130, mitochondrial [Rosa chinensis]XP_040368013.1 pentatricopeptide repeat-containing protein At3g04130, mitochondrial [Rosa chinensis]PRQ20011.1